MNDKIKEILFKIKIPTKWKINWYTFWKNWHYVKYYYYGSRRHLKKTRKLQLKIRTLVRVTKTIQKE